MCLVDSVPTSMPTTTVGAGVGVVIVIGGELLRREKNERTVAVCAIAGWTDGRSATLLSLLADAFATFSTMAATSVHRFMSKESELAP